MIRHKSVGWMTLVLVALVGPFVVGQDESAAELYGRGVHAYFAGDFSQAITLLSESLAQRRSDPRAYYFRGLAAANVQGVEAGLPDFMQGADVEYNHKERALVDINGALQRVQGALRLELESVRTATREAAIARQKERNRVRYEECKRREDIVLFDPDRPATPLDVDLPAPDLGGAPDPFASGLAFSGGKQVEVVVPADVPGGDAATMAADGAQPRDPFAGDTAEAAATNDPFAAPLAKPAAPGPAAPGATAPPDVANPFGEDLPPLDLEYEDEPPSRVLQAAGGVMNVLGKALSGQAADRDPFGAPVKKVEADSPQVEEAPQPPATDTPAEKPAEEAQPAQTPADEPDDPFK